VKYVRLWSSVHAIRSCQWQCHQDLKSNNLSLNEATNVAENRPLWRLMSMFGSTYSHDRNKWMNDLLHCVTASNSVSSGSMHNVRLCCIGSVLTTVVYIVQVKDHWELRLKLIAVMMSLSIHMMTSQGRICVQCVTNGLQWKDDWMITERDTLEKTYFHVLSVRNVFYLGMACVAIWIFIVVNTSAKNVTNAVIVVTSWQRTHKLIQERNHICVQCVTNGLQRKDIWMITERDTLEKTCIHVLGVRNVFHIIVACMSIWTFIEVNTSAQNVADVVIVVITWQHTDEVIQERNHLNVLFVANDLHRLETLFHTAEFTVERNHTNVTCVARRLVGLEI